MASEMGYLITVARQAANWYEEHLEGHDSFIYCEDWNRTPEEYLYRVHYSAEDKQFVGTVAEFPLLSWLADSADAALTGIRNVVQETITSMLEDGEPVPQPLSKTSRNVD